MEEVHTQASTIQQLIIQRKFIIIYLNIYEKKNNKYIQEYNITLKQLNYIIFPKIKKKIR